VLKNIGQWLVLWPVWNRMAWPIAVKYLASVVTALVLLSVLSNVGSQPKQDASTNVPQSGSGAVRTVASSTPRPAPTSTQPAPTSTPAPKIGDTVTKGNWSYLVTRIQMPGKSINTGNQFLKLDALGTWLAVYMTLKNVGSSNFPINEHDFGLIDSAGTKSDVTTHIIEMYTLLEQLGLQKLGQQIPPGVSFNTAVLFDINPSATGLKLNLIQANTLVDLGR
jgi:hypothetical protein